MIEREKQDEDEDEETSEVVRTASSSKQSTASVLASETAWKRLEIFETGMVGDKILSGAEGGKPPRRAQSFKGGGLRVLEPHSTRMASTLELPATALISLKIGEEEVMVRLADAVMTAVKEEKELLDWIGAEKAEVLTMEDGRLGEIASIWPG